MIREIKFRGKRVNNGAWVYGYLTMCTDGSCYITTEIERNVLRYVKGKPSYVFTRIEYEVDPKTVGQYTGLKDKNGVGIYEGDIVQNELGEVFLVEYVRFGYVLKQTGEPWCKFPYEYDEYEVISNKWDDSSLLLGGKQDDS